MNGRISLPSMPPILLIGAGILVAPRVGVSQVAQVSLQVSSSSWIPGSRFDEPGFIRSSRQAGIEIVPERSERTLAPGLVKYSETKGPGFSPFGIGAPVGFGTNIAFELILLDAKTATTLLRLAVNAGTSGGVPKEQFHASALEIFKASAGYRLSCDRGSARCS